MSELYFSIDALSVSAEQLQLTETGPVKMQMVWTVLQASNS